MKTEILVLLFCFLNVCTEQPLEEKNCKRTKVESAMAEPHIDMFSPLFLIEL